MRVKKFQANNMAEAMKMVKAELGPNAIILHSRDLGKGLLGFFLGKGVEVTAGVDPKETRKPGPPPQRKESNPLLQTPPPPSSSQSKVGAKVDFKVQDQNQNDEVNPLLALSQKLQKENDDLKQAIQHPLANKNENKNSSQSNHQEQPSNTQKQPNNNQLETRLSHMENQLNKLTDLIEKLVPSITSGQVPTVPNRTRELYNHLLEQDVDESLALSIATQIADTTDENDDVWTALKTHLTSLIQTAEPAEMDFDSKSPKVLLLIGPTGVGKTTSLAKISAQYRYTTESQKRPKIVFITADLYRLAAVEQLQKYTEILGCELEVTYSAEEAKQAVQKHKDANLILFDTAGTCQRNMPQMGTLKSICEACEPTEIHLVLSATTKFSDLVDVVEHFKEVTPSRFIFTKIDESTTYGTLLNIQHKYKIPVSYLTTGQNVPEDIERAKPERIAKLLMTKPTVNRTVNDITISPQEKSNGEAASNNTTSSAGTNKKTENASNQEKKDEE